MPDGVGSVHISERAPSRTICRAQCALRHRRRPPPPPHLELPQAPSAPFRTVRRLTTPYIGMSATDRLVRARRCWIGTYIREGTQPDDLPGAMCVTTSPPPSAASTPRASTSPERTVPYGAAVDYTLHWYERHRPPCTCPTVLDRYIYPRGHPAGRSAGRNVRYDIAAALRRLHTSSFHKPRAHRSVRCGG